MEESWAMTQAIAQGMIQAMTWADAKAIDANKKNCIFLN